MHKISAVVVKNENNQSVNKYISIYFSYNVLSTTFCMYLFGIDNHIAGADPGGGGGGPPGRPPPPP
jgi:hypothetical protein